VHGDEEKRVMLTTPTSGGLGQEFGPGIFKHFGPPSSVQQFFYRENYHLKT
jgi:hypothetical protein